MIRRKIKEIDNNKGFTMIEMIVVIVIIAILAALIAPRLTGWIEESNTGVALSEGKMFLTASQGAFVKQYTKGVLKGESNYIDCSQKTEKQMISKSKAKIAAKVLWDEYGDKVADMEIMSLNNDPTGKKKIAMGMLYATDTRINPFLIKTKKGDGRYVLYDGETLKTFVKESTMTRDQVMGELLKCQ